MAYKTSSSIVLLGRLFLSVILLAVSCTPLLAQENTESGTPDQPSLVLKRTVRRVVLDVVVTDKDGKAVPGLEQKDFSIREDNKKQKILSFDVHNLETGSDFAKLPPLPPNTFINVPSAPERGPLYVLLLDLVNTRMDDEAYARKQLLKFVSGKPAGTRFAIFVLSDELYLAQGFTDDQAKLYAVLDPAHPRRHIPRIFLYQDNFGRGNTGKMVHVLTSIARYLDGLPGRKNLIWFAGEFPMQLFPEDSDPADYKEEVKGTINALALSQTSIYPVDIRGVVVENAHAPAGDTGGGGLNSDYRTGGKAQPATDGSASGSAQGNYQPNQGQAAGQQGYSLLAHDYMIEDEIARVTGGHAFYSTNDLTGALADATENGASYYTLTYAPSNDNYDGSLRNIRVDLAKQGYHLAYRRSYYSSDPDKVFSNKQKRKEVATTEETAVRKVGDSLYANMQHGAPLAHQLYFRAHIRTQGSPALATAEQMANLAEQPAYFRVRRKNRPLKPLRPVPLQTYLVDYTMLTQAKQAKSVNTRPPALEIAVAVFNADGQMLNGVVKNTDTNTQPEQAGNPTNIYRAEEEIEAPLDAAFIRIAVRDITTDRIGAMEVSLPLASEPQAEASVPMQSQPKHQ